MGNQARADDRWSFACGKNQLITLLVLSLAASIVPQTASAQTRERSGKEVVETVCAACHGTGVKGAPKIGDKKAWSRLASRGLTSLTESALKGVREMPAHGGNMALTDIEIQRAITYMVNRSGGKWTEPISGSTPAVERSGEQIVQAQCAKCHRTGVNGAPKIGDRDAWLPRVKQGLDFLVRSAIHGHGPMPARGGVADLTDSEIRDAILYMMFTPSQVPAEKPSQVPAEKPPTAPPKVPETNRKVIRETEIYLGIVPAESIRAQYAKGSPESSMHGGVPSGEGYYHLNISLFDSGTRALITDAQVEVSVREPVYGGETKKLKLLTPDKMKHYGNYFRMSSKSPYTITVRIQRPDVARPIEAKFDYKH